MPGPEFLAAGPVSLCTIEEEDIPFLHEHVNDPSVWGPIGRSRPLNGPQEREFFEEVVSSDESVQLLVVADDTRVGTVGLSSIDWEAHKGELGYWIAPAHRREGYGSVAARLLVDHAFTELGLHKVSARVFEFNEASQRLLEGIGFTREGVHREDHFVNGDYHDTHWYGVLRREWPPGDDGPA